MACPVTSAPCALGLRRKFGRPAARTRIRKRAPRSEHPESASRRTPGAPGRRRDSAAASAPTGAPPCGRLQKRLSVCPTVDFEQARKIARRHGGNPRLTWRPRSRLSLPLGEAAVCRRRDRRRSLVGHLGSDATTRADACSVGRATATRACGPWADRAAGKRFSECRSAWLSGSLGAAGSDAAGIAQRGAASSRLLELDQSGSVATALIRLGSEMKADGGEGGVVPLEAAGSHLRACELCWLATNGPHGLTCCALYYALPEPWCLLVMSSERPRHVANLKTESACSVCVPRLLRRTGFDGD